MKLGALCQQSNDDELESLCSSLNVMEMQCNVGTLGEPLDNSVHRDRWS